RPHRLLTGNAQPSGCSFVQSAVAIAGDSDDARHRVLLDGLRQERVDRARIHRDLLSLASARRPYPKPALATINAVALSSGGGGRAHVQDESAGQLAVEAARALLTGALRARRDHIHT